MDNIEKTKTWTVYVHISPSNKRYVGITSQKNLNGRWRNGKGYKNNPHFVNAINKYGWENFEHKVLANELPEDVAKQMEKDYIKKYNSINPDFGYNISQGGDGTCGVSHYGETNPFYGKHHTEEMKRVASNRMKEAWKSGEIGASITRPIFQFSMTGDFLNSYNSIYEAERITGVPHSVISRVCKGKLNYTHNYTWAYQDDCSDKLLFKKQFLEKIENKKNNQIKRNRSRLGKPVLLYDLDWNLIKRYETATLASKDIGVHKDTIAYACRKHGMIQKKYYACYE